MKKNINKLILSFATLALIMSCESTDNGGVDPIGYSPVAITASSMENNVTVMENAIVGGMASYTITATIPAPQVVHTIMNLSQTGGTAVAGSDFDFDHNIVISPGDTSGTATVNVYASGDIETSETFTISASTADDKSFLTSPYSFRGTITDDYINDVLTMEVDWSGEYTYTAGVPAQVTIDFCNMDVDLLVYSSLGADMGIYDAATGACPENVDFSGLPDDTYFLVANIWDNPFSGLGAAAPMPITLTYSQEYFINETVIVNNGLTSDTATGSNIVVALLEVVDGYIYTVTPQ